MEGSSSALPLCLTRALFGASTAGASQQEHTLPFIACVGCRLGQQQLSPIEAFVHAHATNVPPWDLYKLAEDLYTHRVRPTLGDEAPEWTADAIQSHYESCAFSVRLTVIGKLRELRGLREMLYKQLAQTNEAPPGSQLALYTKVCAHESAQRVLLDGMPVPSTAQPLAPPPPPAQPPARPLWPQSRSPSSPRLSSADDAASVASTTRAEPSNAVAEEALRGALSEWLEPCAPAAVSAQPTLGEMLKGSRAADVVGREQRAQRQAFQDERPFAGRRCFCRGANKPCYVRLSKAFLRQLAEDSPVLERAFPTPSAMRLAILSALKLRVGDIRRRKGFRSHTLFGFRERVNTRK